MARVSIICPLHNKGAYIDVTIRSVLAQTMPDWELIVVENGSEDDGPARVEKSSDHRIRYFNESQRVFGPGAARNVGLDRARGEWILFLDADDALEETYLETLLNRAEELPEAQIIAAPWKEYPGSFESDGEAVVKYPAGFRGGPKELQCSSIAFTCWAVHAALIERRWLQAKRWPERLDKHLAEDTAFWFQVTQGARIEYVDSPGALYRCGTEGGRNRVSAARWFEGNHLAVQANLRWLDGRGKRVSAGQIENLVRLYEGLAYRAAQEGDWDVETRARNEAGKWLRQLCGQKAAISWSMRLRCLLGIVLFGRLRSWVTTHAL